LIEALRAAALDGPGELTPELRRAAASGDSVPADLAMWVETVRERAYATTDADVEALHRAGYSEAAIFEVTVAAALGAGLARFDAGVRALR
jgi:alkylhydroperoxidase family enzyme